MGNAGPLTGSVEYSIDCGLSRTFWIGIQDKKNVIFSRLPRSAPVMAAMCVLAALAVAQGRSATHIVPFFPAASDTRPQGLVRIVNLADEPGTLDIVAIDAAGARFEGVSLALGAGETAHFDSDDLESGNPDAGLTGATGRGQGDWRLELNSTLDLEVQAYVRTREGELAEMYETAAGAGDRFRIATFNPGSNVNQVGLLWLFNRGDEPVAVTVQGTDDLGQSPGPGVSIDLPSREARTYTAAELESGAAPGLSGSLGDGAGKWRLDGEASGQVLAMSLISSPTGHLTNLSTLPSSVSDGVHRVPLFPPASDTLGRQGFARVINRSDADGEVRIEAFDGTDWSYEALTLTLEAGETQQFNSTDLELGNPAKGLTGSTGAGDGDWRLELRSELDLEVLSYVRTVGGQGYVTPMHDTAAREAEGLMRYYVPIFHAAEYEAQESRLHLFNAGEAEARVGIAGLDDAGLPPPEGDVSLVLGAGETRVVTAEELENGGEGLDGWFGSGAGRWRLLVSSGEALQVMSLGYGADGFLANLSRGSPPAYAVQSGAPDLVVETLSVSDGTPDSGETFTLSAMVRNRGDGDAEATTLRYYRSTNANISASDLEVGTVRVDALSASGSGDESIALAAPSEAGTYYYGACVDPVADESDIANNCSAAVAVTVTVPRPNLTVGPPAVDTANPDPGAAFELSVSVANDGDGDAGASRLNYYRSADAVVTAADTPVGSDALAALAAGDQSGESIPLTAPDTAGTYYYGACVEPVSGESDTTDNCSSSVAVTVVDPTPVFPDLVVGTPTVSENRPVPGSAFELTATVHNTGGGASNATTLRYYRSTDAVISTSDTPVDTAAVGALAASGTSRHAVTVTAPAIAGTYYYGACVDTVADETDAGNNCSVGVEIGVEKPVFPDLVVGAPTASENTLQVAAAFTLSATVTNRGDGDAEATMLNYYRSTEAAFTTMQVMTGSQPVGALAAAGSSSHSVTVTAPSTEDTYYFRACVDPVTDESNTANNCSVSVAVTVEAPAPAPDLVVRATLSESSVPPGGSFTLTAEVRNAGSADAAATTLRFLDTENQLGQADVQALTAGGTDAGSLDLTAPSAAGTYRYGACVDEVEDESDTTNNCSWVSLPVGRANLVTTIPRIFQRDLGGGTGHLDHVVHTVVRNVGTVMSPAPRVTLYGSWDATASPDDKLYRTFNLMPLAPGAVDCYSYGYVAPPQKRDYYYAVVDMVPNETSTEDNESDVTKAPLKCNNCVRTDHPSGWCANRR